MVRLALLSAAHTHTKGFIGNITANDDRDLAVIYDDVADRGQRFAAEAGTEYSGDLAAVLARDDVDGFIVCAANTQHVPLLRAAVPVGKPIFCEKPFTTSVDDALELHELIQQHGTPVHMGYFQPFTPDMQGVIASVASGALGQITHARYRNAHAAAYGRWFDSPDLSWFTQPDLSGGGAFMDMGTHAVHRLISVLGPVAEAMAIIGNASGIYPDVDDHGVAWLRFVNGALGTVEGSWVQTGGMGGFEIVGSEGTIFEHPERGMLLGRSREEPVEVAAGEARPTTVDRLVATIRGELTREELNADLLCAIDAVAAMDACYASSESGGWVAVKQVSR